MWISRSGEEGRARAPDKSIFVALAVLAPEHGASAWANSECMRGRSES